MKRIYFVPDMPKYVREVTNHGPIMATVKEITSLSPIAILKLAISQSLHLRELLAKDFAAGILLLSQVEILRSKNLPPHTHLLLHQSVTDLAIALNRPDILTRFLQLANKYNVPSGLATANLDYLEPFLGQYKISPQLVFNTTTNEALSRSSSSPHLVAVGKLKPKDNFKFQTSNFKLPSLSVIIPVYNEEKTVLPLLGKLISADIRAQLEIIIIDDGSGDGTRERLEQNFKKWLKGSKIMPLGHFTQPIKTNASSWFLREYVGAGLEKSGEHGKDAAGTAGSAHAIKIFQSRGKARHLEQNTSYERLMKLITLRHETNLGKGAAIRSGLKLATGDFTVIQDADLEYEPGDIQRLLNYLEHSDSPVVYGSRRLGNNSFHHAGAFFYYGGLLLNHLTNLLYRQRLTDEATCYKMFRTKFLKSLPLISQHFEFCPEVTAIVSKRGFQIPEIPISYHPRSIKDGKKIRLRDGLKAITTLIKYKLEPQKTAWVTPSGKEKS